MLVRPATPEDVPALRLLEQQAEQAAHWSEREYGALFAPEAPPRIALVSVDDENPPRILGFIIARVIGSEWEIENVVVAGEYRRRGFGAALVREVLLRATAAAVTSVLLDVRESNAPARRLYETLGFIEQGRRPRYYQRPTEDALLLRFLITVL